ncbi:MAG TPA: PDZ domain-containing protein [Bryobacteraceae bacterium]
MAKSILWYFSVSFVLLLSFASHAVLAASDAGGTRLLRTPTVSKDHIAFAYANNIWIVDRKGGSARRLTSFQGQTSNPHLSPDGKLVAFSAEYEGNMDVYVVGVDGSEPKRLTWHPAPDLVEGWTPDGKSILFTSTRASEAPIATPRFWTVPLAGGFPEPMALPRGYQGKFSPDGSRIAYRMNNSWDEERRNYRGGQNRPIWIADLHSYDVVTPAWSGSKDMDPVWVGNDVYFISDRDGVANVWAFDTKSKALRQVTKFTGFDVKSLDACPGAVVFEQAGYIHDLDPASGKTHVVEITASGDFPWMMPRWEDVAGRMTHMILSPTGKRVAVEARGEIFTIPADKGDVRNLTHSSGSAERDPAWSPDGKYLSYFSDKSGEYKLVIEAQNGIEPPRELTLPHPTHYYTPSWSPDSKKLLYTDTNLKVWVLDVANGSTKMVGEDPWMVPARTLNSVWSPDSKYVAYASRLKSLYHAIFVTNVETGEKHQVTDGLADSVWPTWDVSGKYLWFFASTDLGLNSQWLDMTHYDHDEHFGLYLAILNKNEPSPLLPQSDEDNGLAAAPEAPEAQAGKTHAPKVPVTVNIDFDGLQNRILAVPGVPLRQYSLLRAGAAGTVFYLEDLAGDQTPGVPMGPTLHRYRLSDRKTVPFAHGVVDYDVSADGHKLVYRLAAPHHEGTATPPPPGPPAAPSLFLVDADKEPPPTAKGRLNYALRMYLDPREEFKQIFYEGWRNQRDYLYVPNMHGADWPRMREMYGEFLPSVMHRADLNYLLDMMGSEIAIGHSFVRGGDMPPVPPTRVGLLGADFIVEKGRYKITHIYDTESWNPELHAPLATPGVKAAVGDYVIAVNGEELRAPDSLYRLLDGTAGQQTVLLLNNRPETEGGWRVTVVPVPNEQALRTRAWVEANRRLVDKLSDGKLAYAYLPNTGQPGYQSFNRYYFAQQEKQGAVIDERFNGGGSAADYIIDVLERKIDGYFNNVAGDRYPFTSPSAGIWGPKVMIINEMAGSGGDLMPWMFRHRKVGLLVGERTWGGLVHTADTPAFIDGGTMIAPRGGFFTAEGKWAVENEGIAPDVEVENWPKEVIAGHDPQLERAVQEALRMLKQEPPKRLTHEPPPPTWGERKIPLGSN